MLAWKMKDGLTILASMMMMLSVGSADARTIHFSGMDWQVKSGTGGPNPNQLVQNYWSDSPHSVWVDSQGRLHLKIRYEDGLWKCAEVESSDIMRYGDYTWEISDRVDNMDPNVVFGLFLYSDQHDYEYDIEFSRWGDDGVGSKNAFYSCWGPGADNPLKKAFQADLSGDYSTHVLKWYEGGLSFASYHGHSSEDLISSWQPDHYPKATPDSRMRLHINLWLNGERHPFLPGSGDIEIVVNRVSIAND